MMDDLIDQLMYLATAKPDALPENALFFARASLFDWLVCGLAGKVEPVARKLGEYARAEGGKEVASLFVGGKTTPRLAALANGGASHALDYDDTHFAHIGHLSVGIYPAAVAAGEEASATAQDVVAAFLVGAEAAIRVGLALGPEHYNRGFHQTATAGAFGATIAAGRLYGLSTAQMRAAIGLCATRASGLKSQFGTMGKPYNAGVSASNGIECASLARLGMTSCDDGLGGPQGFLEAHGSGSASPETFADRFLFTDNIYKFHACCHGTHAMIEALLEAKREHGFSLGDVTSFKLRTNPRWLSVCDIATPRTGLEVKFSYRWLAGMTLGGWNTASDRTYTDALTGNETLGGFSSCVTVEGDPSLTELQATGEVTLKDGRVLDVAHDIGDPMSPELLKSKLAEKAQNTLGDRAVELSVILSQRTTLTAREIGNLMRSTN